jgi:hypothetical protein
MIEETFDQFTAVAAQLRNTTAELERIVGDTLRLDEPDLTREVLTGLMAAYRQLVAGMLEVGAEQVASLAEFEIRRTA